MSFRTKRVHWELIKGKINLIFHKEKEWYVYIFQIILAPWNLGKNSSSSLFKILCESVYNEYKAVHFLRSEFRFIASLVILIGMVRPIGRIQIDFEKGKMIMHGSNFFSVDKKMLDLKTCEIVPILGSN